MEWICAVSLVVGLPILAVLIGVGLGRLIVKRDFPDES